PLCAFLLLPPPPLSPLFPYTTLFRSILTSIAYMPVFGIASAGTTLVGQSIGARSRDWALQVGDRVILLAALYMGAIGVLIALGRSEEHTSELQSLRHLVCRLLLEKKK